MDWKTRLAVSYDEGKGEVAITPIDSFSPTFTITSEALHSIEATHIGVIHSPQAITFSMTVKAIGDPAAKLTSLAMEAKRFDIILQETDDGTDWSFTKIVLSDCLITSAAPTAASTTGAPTAVFSGYSLGASSTPKTGRMVEIP